MDAIVRLASSEHPHAEQLRSICTLLECPLTRASTQVILFQLVQNDEPSLLATIDYLTACGNQAITDRMRDSHVRWCAQYSLELVSKLDPSYIPAAILREGFLAAIRSGHLSVAQHLSRKETIDTEALLQSLGNLEMTQWITNARQFWREEIENMMDVAGDDLEIVTPEVWDYLQQKYALMRPSEIILDTNDILFDHLLQELSLQDCEDVLISLIDSDYPDSRTFKCAKMIVARHRMCQPMVYDLLIAACKMVCLGVARALVDSYFGVGHEARQYVFRTILVTPSEREFLTELIAQCDLELDPEYYCCIKLPRISAKVLSQSTRGREVEFLVTDNGAGCIMSSYPLALDDTYNYYLIGDKHMYSKKIRFSPVTLAFITGDHEFDGGAHETSICDPKDPLGVIHQIRVPQFLQDYLSRAIKKQKRAY